MNKKIALVASISALAGLVLAVASPGAVASPRLALTPSLDDQTAQGGQGSQQGGGEKKPAWKSRDEYDAFQAMANEKDGDKRVQLAEAFVQKYPNSDFKDTAYQVEMSTYQQKGESEKAIAAAKKTLDANPDNITALNYVAFTSPFLFKADDPNKDAKLSEMETHAKRGLEVLQKTQKPANISEDQFNQQIKVVRTNLNNAVGFVALQRKDYAAAITSLKAAAEDDPSNSLTFSLLGQSYLYSKPPEFDTAIWDLGRAAALAKSASSANAPALEKFYNQVYSSRHGSDQGAQDVLTQAASSPTPPSGFKVNPPERHKPTGNQAVDAFYNIQDNLRVGGDQEKQAWQQVKGQPYGFGGPVDSVEKGPGGDSTLARIDITDDSKAKEGVYDIVLRTKQPDAKYLKKGDLVRFTGTIAEYTLTPSFSLTLDGTINQEDLDAAKAGKQKGTARPTPRRRTTGH